MIYEVPGRGESLETEDDFTEAGSGSREGSQGAVDFLCALIKMFGNEPVVLFTVLCSPKITCEHTL